MGKVPLNDVDLFLCSQLSTPDYTGIVPERGSTVPIPEVSEKYFRDHPVDVAVLGALQSESVLPMLKALPKHPRFAEASLGYYVLKIDREKEEQFSAVTVFFPDGCAVVCYQGTDDTIVGWKENFNTAVYEFVPAQHDAALYLERVARHTEGPLYVVGHSKGGNLAVYAAAHACKKTNERIVRVISYDGPGFHREFVSSEGYRRIADRTYLILSQNAMVGVLMHPVGQTVIVKSHNKGVMAHDGFSWEVKGDRFVRCSSFSKESDFFDKTMDNLIESLSPAERTDFINGLFDALFATGSVTVTDLKRLKFNQVILVIRRFAAKKRLSKTISVALDAIFHQERYVRQQKKKPAALPPPKDAETLPADGETEKSAAEDGKAKEEKKPAKKAKKPEKPETTDRKKTEKPEKSKKSTKKPAAK